MQTLNLKILPRDLRSKDTRHLLSLIFSQWLPISTCTFQAVVDVVPPPSVAQRLRVPAMLYPDAHSDDPNNFVPKNKVEEDLYHCNAGPDACVVAYVSKMFAVPEKELPKNKRKEVTAEEMRAKGRAAREARLAEASGVAANGETETSSAGATAKPPSSQNEVSDPIQLEGETLLGFARLYSGTITRSMKLLCTLPRYNANLPPSHPSSAKQIAVVEVTALYVMMGRELVPVERVAAGNVFALAGLAGVLWRNGTLCGMPSSNGNNDVQIAHADKDYLVNLAGVANHAAPIVRVALEPENPGT